MFREVYAEFNQEDRLLTVVSFFDTPPTEEEYGEAAYTITDLESHTVGYKTDFEVVTIPYPEKVQGRGFCVYRRYEPSFIRPLNIKTLSAAAAHGDARSNSP